MKHKALCQAMSLLLAEAQSLDARAVWTAEELARVGPYEGIGGTREGIIVGLRHALSVLENPLPMEVSPTPVAHIPPETGIIEAGMERRVCAVCHREASDFEGEGGWSEEGDLCPLHAGSGRVG